jgi:hypothetical protein
VLTTVACVIRLPVLELLCMASNLDGSDESTMKPRVIEVSRRSAVESVAKYVSEIEDNRMLPALLLRPETDETNEDIGWLDQFTIYWASISQAGPWQQFRALPLLIVDAAELSHASREVFRQWGVSSFVEGESVAQVQEGLARSLARADELDSFKKDIPEGAVAPEIESDVRQGLGTAAAYEEALRALQAMEKQGTERDD